MNYKGKRVEAVTCMRTSSATNVGDDKDSERRERAAIEGFCQGRGLLDRGLDLRSSPEGH
jgi:hypothetical protein